MLERKSLRNFGLIFVAAAWWMAVAGAVAAHAVRDSSVRQLRTEIEKLAAPAHGHVGAAALLVESGETISWHGEQRFPMQSVYKFPIAMAVLHRVDEGKLSLDQQVEIDPAVDAPVYSPIRDKYPKGGVKLPLRELLRAAIVDSDGAACDLLLRLVSAPEVTKYLEGLGVSGLKVVATEKEMSQDPMVQYRNWATPDAAVQLLGKFQLGEGLSSASRTLLMRWMTDTEIGPHRIKGLLPPGTQVAHKTGTDGTTNGLTRATNDIGLMTLPDGRHLAVAVFVADSKEDEATREAVIAKIAFACWKHWQPQT
jgi:beta-lactamase class A